MASSIEKQDSQLGPESDKNWAHGHNQDHTLKPAGVRKSEAAQKVITGKHKICLIVSIGLAAYIYSLDGSTTWTYLAFAGSALNNHSLITTVQVAQSIIVACGKPFVAKLADSLSRPVAYSLVVFFYVLGYIIIASAQSIATVAGGIVIYAVGYTGLQLLLQIIIADTTTLKWRGLSSGLVAAPFIINAFAGSEVSAGVMASGGPGWRWGYGMFAILVPVTILPLILTLGWAQHKAKSQGLVEPAQSSAIGMNKFKAVWEEVDMLGLLILAGGVACVLLPLTLAKSAKEGWANSSMIAMLTIGPILFIAFGIHEWKFAAYPIVPMRFLRNKAVVGAALIGFFDFVSFYLTFSYLYSFVFVIKGWELRYLNYFSSTQTVALTVFGIIAGAIMRTTHRYKWMLVTGLFIRLFGVGLMIHSRGAKGNTGELVMTQVIQGLGGGFAAVASQVSAQASVPHSEVAIVTAMVLLVTEIGGAIGTAMGGSTSLFPGIIAIDRTRSLEIHLPDVNSTVRAELFSSITTIASYPPGDPIREGVIQAYDETMKVLLIAATAIGKDSDWAFGSNKKNSLIPSAIIPPALVLLMPDYFLGDTQNAVEGTTLTGEVARHVPQGKV
ncbi:Major Facilitator Superfamily [Rhizoctonia solani]|uniref:Major Facilitator Superfamily n=1 Tax=Rhizoctonia solani TaxID=456999 RepID=A0A8H7LJF9_9AGAM|nr:Major Facilitator Superfamily [Rhizoctonia solani]